MVGLRGQRSPADENEEERNYSQHERPAFPRDAVRPVMQAALRKWPCHTISGAGIGGAVAIASRDIA
jgi:hypothetical protein